MSTALLHHPVCALHDMGPGHPESPDRVRAIEDHFIRVGLMSALQVVDAPLATRAQLARVHDEAYIDALAAAGPDHGLVQLDPDTAMNPHSHEAALRAAGAVVRATDLVMQGLVHNAFCNVRPPGHHACRRRPMGFCLFNNVAVGAAHALDYHGLERVAIVDFDVHHGNGTEDIFRDDPRVLMVSTFQHPFYPNSGIEGRSDRMVNVPLAAGSGGARFREAVGGQWLPAIENFAPQMLFISAGFDAHRDDDMAMLELTEADYAWVTRVLLDAGRRHSQGRMVSTLEGGYDLGALARSAEQHVRVLASS